MAEKVNKGKYTYDKYMRNVGILLIKMLLLISLAVGSTFAIFTSRSDSNITITAAEMGMRLYRANEKSISDGNISYTEINGAEGDAFAGIEWEPGATRLIFFKVENAGTIPVNYVLRFVANMGELYGAFEYLAYSASEADFISLSSRASEQSWSTLKASYSSKLLENNYDDVNFSNELKKMETENRISGRSPVYLECTGGDNTDYFVVALHMKEGAGNEFQKKSCEIIVKLYAEQGNV